MKDSKWENFVRDELLPALRSGEYTKGMDRLYQPRMDSHCCLGVVCDILERKHGLDLDWRDDVDLPGEVVAYFDSAITRNPIVTFSKGLPNKSLSWVNDSSGADEYRAVIELLEDAVDPDYEHARLDVM